ncbi:MAG: O-antigen ligase family protein [Cyanobacteria bacterium J06639_1]
MTARIASVTAIRPETLEEKAVWYYLLGTYGWYLLGAQYLLVWGLAWGLTAYLVWRWWWPVVSGRRSPADQGITEVRVPLPVWIWIATMVAMLVPIAIGHLNFQLGLPRIVASTVEWSREWALFALFPLIGCFRIRPQVLYRGVSIVCVQSLFVAALCYAAALVGLPEDVYVSPLSVGGGGTQLYSVSLYLQEYGSAIPRLYLFAPWCPALGSVGAMYFFLANRDPDPRWRWFGCLGAAVMVVSSVSRLAIIALPLAAIATWYLVNIARPAVLMASAFGSFGLGAIAPLLTNVLGAWWQQFRSLRADSSNVREAINRIGLYRWWNDAPMWGHGLVAPGLSVTHGMPIGTHNTWIGLLFRHGIVGCTLFTIPAVWSAAHLLLLARDKATARVAIAAGAVLVMFTLSETIESLAYLYWPGLVIFGIAFRESMPAGDRPRLLSHQTSPPQPSHP